MRNNWLDGMAIGASALCLAHCLALPFLFLALPTVSVLLGEDESVHLIVLFFALPTSAYALFSGLSAHRQLLPVLAGASGLILLCMGLWFEREPQIETIVTICGSLSLAFGHVANWQQRHRVASRLR